MSATALVIQQSALQLGPVLRVLAGVGAAATLLIVFRPLLVGVLRAAVLVVRPRKTREQLAAAAHLRDQRMLQKMIAASSSPSHAAELRALAARA